MSTVKYADEFVLLAVAETVLQGLIDRVADLGKRYGMEMNVKKNKKN